MLAEDVAPLQLVVKRSRARLDGRWAMDDGRWAMGNNGRRATGDGRRVGWALPLCGWQLGAVCEAAFEAVANDLEASASANILGWRAVYSTCSRYSKKVQYHHGHVLTYYSRSDILQHWKAPPTH